jgi:hypothetical protein
MLDPLPFMFARALQAAADHDGGFLAITFTMRPANSPPEQSDLFDATGSASQASQ